MPFDIASSPVTFQEETWAAYARDAEPIWRAHYDEIAADKANMPMGPNHAVYEELERRGALVVLTARKDGALVGYFVGIVHRHMHYDVMCGTEDAYFLLPEHRKGLTGFRLLRTAERALKDRGAKLALFHTKASKNLGLLYERMGFEKSDIIYRKRLG